MAFHNASGARYILSNLCSCLFHVLREQTAGSPFGLALRANIDETESAAIITEQGGQENHRERSQDCCSFRNQFA
jgi:hypothetical protein